MNRIDDLIRIIGRTIAANKKAMAQSRKRLNELLAAKRKAARVELEPLEPRTLASATPLAPVDLSPHSLVMGPFAPALEVGNRSTAPGQNKQPAMPPPITPVLPPVRTVIVLADPADMNPVTLPAGATLWGDNGIADPADVKQGYYGNCWMMGPFMGMALNDPVKLMTQIQPDGHGGFLILVDATTAYDMNGTYFAGYGAQIGPDHAFWPSLLEKYVAARMGGYANISGNWMSTAGYYMGWTYTSESIPTTAEAAAAWVINSAELMQTITLGSGSGAGDGVVPNHCYFIDGVQFANNVYTFQVDQPWEYGTYRLQLTFEQLTNPANFYFQTVVIS